MGNGISGWGLGWGARGGGCAVLCTVGGSGVDSEGRLSTPPRRAAATQRNGRSSSRSVARAPMPSHAKNKALDAHRGDLRRDESIDRWRGSQHFSQKH